MNEEELLDFIREREKRGFDKESIIKALERIGYHKIYLEKFFPDEDKKDPPKTIALEKYFLHNKFLLGFIVFAIAISLGTNILLYKQTNLKIDLLSNQTDQKFTQLNSKMSLSEKAIETKLLTEISNKESSLKSEIKKAENLALAENKKTRTAIEQLNTATQNQYKTITTTVQDIKNKSNSEIGSIKSEVSYLKGVSVDFSKIIPNILPAVVAIGENTSKTIFNLVGSGAIIDQSGYIVTNKHVTDGLTNILIKTNDKTEYAAEIIGQSSSMDIAVLKIKSQKTFPTLTLSLQNAFVGQKVIAIGNPAGLDFTVTEGIISNTARKLPPDYSISYLQTDVAVNKGNSGGPLVEKTGKIIGMNTKKMLGNEYEGLNFALKSTDISTVIKQWVEKDKKKK